MQSNTHNSIKDYLEYNDLSLKRQRVSEDKSIIDDLQPLSDYILGNDFSKKVFTIDCYTKRVFPRLLSISQNISVEYAILWDSHLWDLYAHFLKVYAKKIKSGSSKDKEMAENYYNSILFSYLSCRFFDEPTFSLALAKAYNRFNYKMPPYNEKDNIINELEILNMADDLSVAKLFVFAHEITHIAFKEGLTNTNSIKKELCSYCDVINQMYDLHLELLNLPPNKNLPKDEFSIYSVAQYIENNPNDLIIEEICCDALSLIAVNEFYKHKSNITEKHRNNLMNSLVVFMRFYGWLYSMEGFWDALKSVNEDPVENDCAFVDPNNKYYNISEKISAKLNTRMALTFMFVNDRYDVGIHWNEDELSDLNAVIRQANGLLFINEIMAKIQDDYYEKKGDLFARTQVAKKKQYEATKILGWFQENPRNTSAYTKATKDERHVEGTQRIRLLIKFYGLNPNVLPYFEEKKLYYSYVTGGGLIGSIDTISYSNQYEKLVEIFETNYDCTVYHAIECDASLFLLYVGNNRQTWSEEIPTKNGLFGALFNRTKMIFEFGYIQVDVIQGALYRRNKRLYTSFDIAKNNQEELSDIDKEVINRLRIMISLGLETDLDIIELYKNDKEVMVSLPMEILGQLIGVINRVSEFDLFSQVVSVVRSSGFTPFFCINIPKSKKIAVLYVSREKDEWELERNLLNYNTSTAIVFDLRENKAEFKEIKYTFIGGPIV